MAKKTVKRTPRLAIRRTTGKVGVPAALANQGFKQSPTAPAMPFTAGVTPPSGIKPPPTPDARDSQYTSAIAANLFRRNQGLANLATSDSYARTDADTSVQRLALQQSQANQNANEGANKQGLFYSGILGKRLGDIETGYKGQRDDVTTRLARVLAGNESERQTLIGQYGDPNKEGDYGVLGAQEFAGAKGRLAQYLMDNPIDPMPEGSMDPVGAAMARVSAGREESRIASPFVNRPKPKSVKPRKGKRTRLMVQNVGGEGVWR